jgi:RNA polymerase-binding transcription factor DksA
MTTFDPQAVLDSLEAEYAARVTAIRRDLAASHSPDSAEQAGERQNDEVLQALLVEAELGQAQTAQAKLRLSAGSYGLCLRCGAAIAAARLQALPTAAWCLDCADLAE